MLQLSPDDWARAWYLLAVLLAGSVAVFGFYRSRLQQGLQDAAIWGLIFVALLLAYGARDRIAVLLDPSLGEVTQAGAISLPRGRDGHFHVTLTVDDVAVRFMVDTGATDIVLSQRDARRVGFDLTALNFHLPVSTANGTVLSAPVMLDRVKLGPVTDRDVRAVVNGGALDVSLLGMAWLDRFTRVAIEGDRMLLQR